jgi:hypothetical protein
MKIMLQGAVRSYFSVGAALLGCQGGTPGESDEPNGAQPDDASGWV